MVPALRERFNAQWSDALYQQFLQNLQAACGVQIGFRTCETPAFFPVALIAQMEQAGLALISQLQQPAYHAAAARAIPAAFAVPNEGTHPHFIQVDFAITQDAAGQWQPKLIELQGCASLYAFQYLLPREFRKLYDLGAVECYLSGLTESSYLALLREVLLNGHDPKQVVLLEINPLQQKTLPDFKLTELLFGIPTVDISHLRKRGNKLYYNDATGREIEIRRLYNRVIIDEFVKKQVQIQFDFRDELDVEWAGHPNWYFRMSKFSLPYLQHPTVPRAWFLSQLDDDPHGLPNDLSAFVLKPLFSFAGSGVKVDVSRADLEAIPAAERGDYLLQEKIQYAPAVQTPGEPSKVEVRVMYVWPERAAAPVAVTTLTRFSKGAMMGVDFNKNKTWVGSSCGFFPV